MKFSNTVHTTVILALTTAFTFHTVTAADKGMIHHGSTRGGTRGGTYRSGNGVQHQTNPSMPNFGTRSRALVMEDCPSHKKVTIQKFCIQGDCDAGSEGEHRLKLDGDWLYNDFRDYEEGRCHDITEAPKIIEAWKSITIGTEEHDTTSENDSYFATLEAEEWYIPTCATYEIEMAIPHKYETNKKLCWTTSVDVELLGPLFEYELCDEWTEPEESFIFKLKIEPADPPPPVPEKCKAEKKITMYKFCIEGDCDSGAEGEHKLKLDGSWLYNDFKDFREGQCHNLNFGSRTVVAGKSLSVATEEHDNWPNDNDYYAATLTSDKWYNPTCAPYEIRIAKEHTGAKTVTSCWSLSYAVFGRGPFSLNTGVSLCSEWEEPAESFIWMLKIEAIEEESVPANPEDAACMSGETGVTLLAPANTQSGKTQLRSSTVDEFEDRIVKVKNLQAGDAIRGFDEDRKPATCTVEAVGSFGSGPVYGNYTRGHYILKPDSDHVVVHGTDQAITIQDKYDVLTSCPLGVDETGIAFTALDTDFCGGFSDEMSWSDYLLLHKVILRMVRGTGGYWFHGSTYKDLGFLKIHAPVVCETMLRCAKDHDDCSEFEDASVLFIEYALSDSAKQKARDSFHNVGRHRALGSVAAMLSAGGSVRN